MWSVYAKNCTELILKILSDNMVVRTILHWIITLVILGLFAAMAVYWIMYAIDPGASSQEWTFLMIWTGGISVITYSLCKYYLDTYVQVDKI